MNLTDHQYQCLLNFYHEFNDEFYRLSRDVLEAFFARLYAI